MASAGRKVRLKLGLKLELSFLVLMLCVGSIHSIHFQGNPSQYAIYPKWNACVNASLSFEFRSSGTKVGLLAYTDDGGKYDFMQLSLNNGKVNLTLNIVDGIDGRVEIVAGENLDDNRWHKVDIERKRMETTLTVDGFSESKVAIGSDFHFGNIETNSPLYIGGLPVNFVQASELKKLSLPSAAFLRGRFRGEIRNVLYGNCTCQLVRGEVVSSAGVSRDPREACEVNNPCGAGCLCISTDEGPGCDCAPLRCEPGSVTYYHLPMNFLVGDTAVNPSGLDATANGNPRLVRGVSENALAIEGRRQWLRVTGPGHRYECFGDLDKCPMGYTLMLWVQFTGTGDSKGVYMSNGGHSDRSHGIAMYYGNGVLEFVFKKSSGEQWSVEYDNVLAGHWYHVTVTWQGRNGLILYINGNLVARDTSPARKSPVRTPSRHNDFIIGRANDYSGLNNIGTVVVDEFQFWSNDKSAKEVRELGPIYKYYLSMDLARDGTLGTKNLNGKSVGTVNQVAGKSGKAISLSGGGDYIDFGPHSDICLGNMEKCLYGFYMSMWIKFNKLDSNTYFVATGPRGVSIYYEGGRLYAELSSDEKLWRTYWYRPVIGRWYFLEVSWNSKKSFSMYIDFTLEAVQQEYSYHRPRETSHQNFYIGRANTPMNAEKFAAIDVDEFETFYADRDTLIFLGFIQRNKPIHHYFDFDRMSGSRVVHPTYVINTFGSPKLVSGKIGRAISLNGNSQVADIGEHNDMCLGNLDFCHHGAMQAFWLRPGDMVNNMHYMSNGLNGFSVMYSRGRLHVSATTSTRKWTVSVPMVMANKWHFLELSWHPEKGLQVFSNQKLIGETDSGAARSVSSRDLFNPQMNHFYIGRGNVNMRDAEFSNVTVDELEYWFSTRDYLMAHDFIQRGEPMNYLISMEEIRNNRLIHPSLNMPVFGNPKIVTGQVGNALKLNGKSQYVDMGDQQDKCLGNLELCRHGITMAFWVNFQSFENNMYYLSSGGNGIQIYHKDGHVFFTVSQPGKTWQAAVPRADWLRAAKWYFVELSWHPDHGLNVYIDNKLAESVRDPVLRETSSLDGNVYIGRANQGDTTGRFVYADAIFDEMEIWYGRREVLLAFDYILRELIGYETFSMERASNGIIEHPKFNVALVNGGRIVPGKVGNAADLSGNRQYIDLGEHGSRCMGNLELCTHGLTISLYLKARDLKNDIYFLSSPSYSLYYKNGRLHSSFNTQTQSWTTSTTKFRKNIWELIEMSWHKDKGVVLRVNGEEVGKSNKPITVQNDQPGDSPVYVGKSISDNRQEKYANVLVDEVEYHYSSIDNLDARGITNRDPVRHEIFHTGTIQNGLLEHPNRRVTVYGKPEVVPGKIGRAVYLNGRTQYIDLGDDVPCQGSLDRCPRGFTLRFDVKPQRLANNQYFIGSHPISVYYKDGRIYTTVRTEERTYTTSAKAFDQGKWQRVEVSYAPETGVQLYLNGQLAGYTNRFTQTPVIYDISRKTYIGRATGDMLRERYADAIIEDVEFWDARRDYLSDYPLPDIGVTPRPNLPGLSGTPPRVTPRPENIESNTMKKVAYFDGQSNIAYDFNRIDARFFRVVPNEELRFQLATYSPHGLIWYTKNSKRSMHVSMRDGRLVFSLEYGPGGVVQTVVFPERLRLNDGRFHIVQIKRAGRQLTFLVDGREVRAITLPRDMEFLSPGEVLVGGAENPSEITGDVVRENFNGYLGDFEYRKRDRRVKMDVELFALVVPNQDVTFFDPARFPPTLPPLVTRPTRPQVTTPRPTPRQTAITFKLSGSYLRLPSWSVERGSSISFEFRTIEPKGLLLFNGGGPNDSRFMAIELHDGKLYLVVDFGGVTTRHLFSDKIVNDGDFHTVRVNMRDRYIELSLDGSQKSVSLPTRISGKFSLSGPLFVGYVDRSERIPWYVWSETGYRGCLRNLRVNDDIADLHQMVRDQFPLSVDMRCGIPAQQCVRSVPCWSGTCHERWDGYHCDCSATAYTDKNCDKVAPVATLDGHTSIKMRYSKTQTTHTDDISLQFRTPLANALLFETKNRGAKGHVKVYLEGGQIKFETNIGGERKVIRYGAGFNDNDWHTLHVRRRADNLEMWVDTGEHKKYKIPGEGFYLNVDEIILGTHGNITGHKHRYAFIGHLRNFYVNGLDVFRNLRHDSISVPRPTINDLPPIIFYPVTFRSREAFATLPSLKARDTMNLSFMFKTTASSGLILYNAGLGKKFMGVELNYGQLNYVLSDGVTTYLARVGEPKSLNDNRWHYVLIQRLDTGEHIVSVDGKAGRVSTPDEPWEFTGRFFIGGLPDRLFADEKVKVSFSSQNGFQGCIASLNLNGQVPDFFKEAQFDKSLVSQGCLDPGIMCSPTSCSNYGICVQEFAGFWCNCNMTSYVGTGCTEYGVGYRMNSNNNNGVIVYNFPAGRHPDTNSDELAFGFKTYNENGLLARIGSSIVDDFIQVNLVDGHVVLTYNTGEKEHKLIQSSQKYNDGEYHVVRFYRNRDNATLFVDNYPGKIADNTGEAYVFNRQSVIHLGAARDNFGGISNQFDGIVAGFYFNGIRALDLARIGGSQVRTYENVVFVPPPLLLDRSNIKIHTPFPNLKPSSVPPLVTLPVKPLEPEGPVVDPAIIVPSDVGGVGVAWGTVGGLGGASGGSAAGGGGGAGGLVVGVHPIGTGGTGGLSGGPVAGALATAGGPGAAGVFSGVRAGAVLGTVLGILALLSSLMWAFYRCKPGWCPGCGPSAAPATPLDISAPRAGSNLAVVQAQSGAFKTSTVNGGAASSGAQYASYYGASNAQANARAMSASESYDSATLRATGTFSNKGTVIGTPKAQRREIDGQAGGSYSSSTFRQTSSSFSGGQPISPPPPQYNTIGGSYGNSTMSSSYQYQVQNVRTVSMGQHSFANTGLPAGAITLQGPAAEEIRVDCCLITSDGRNVITGSYIGTPHVWDMSNGELVRFMKGNTNGSTDLHLACNDRLLVGDVNADVDVNEFSNRKGVMNRKLQIWDFQSGRPLEMGGDEYCSALCVMSDGDKVVFGRTNQMGTSTSVVVWDLLGNQLIKEMRYDASLGNKDHVCFLALSQNDRYVVAGFRNTIDGQANYVVFDMTLTSYNIVEPSLLMLDAEPDVTVTLPRDEAVTGLRNGDLVIWNLRNGRSSRQLLSNSGHHAHSCEVKALALSEDNRFLVSAAADGTLKLWDMATEKQAYTLTGHGDEVWCCAISCDNEIILSGSRDGTIRLWRLKTGTQMCVFNAQLDIFSVKISRDKGTIVALADKFGTRKLIMLQVVRTKSTRKYSL